MIRVMLITDYPLIGNLIAASLDAKSGIVVVKACTPHVDPLLEAIQETDIDVLLISGELSEIKAIDLVSEIDSLDLPLRMVILGLDERRRSILPFLEAGASGYVLKEASVDDLIKTIRSAYEGQARVSPRIARALIERIYGLASEYHGKDVSLLTNVKLTRREMQILKMLDQNLTNQEIAKYLHVEVGTVKNHVHAILQKLEVSTRQEAARYLALLKAKE